MVVGVLALQGAFAKHREMLGSLGCPSREVRTPQELEGCDGLILPGGESTVIHRHLQRLCLLEPLMRFAQNKPLFGTCAGLILLAKTIEGGSMSPLGLFDIAIERNAYGRQIDSFQGEVELTFTEKPSLFTGLFIRAPRIRQVGSSVQVLGKYQNEPVFIRQGNHLGATFHPELTYDASLHKFFLEQFRQSP